MLTQPAIAEAISYNKETPPQGVACGSRAETAAAGQSLQQLGEAHTSKRSLGRQIVTRLPPSWAEQRNGHSQRKPQTLETEHVRNKKFFNEFCCSRIKRSSLTALNEQQSSQLSI